LDCSQRGARIHKESDKLATLIRRGMMQEQNQKCSCNANSRHIILDVPSGIYHCDGCSGSWGGKEVLLASPSISTHAVLIDILYHPLDFDDN
jgi:ribosomal protein L37AE/L43A